MDDKQNKQIKKTGNQKYKLTLFVIWKDKSFSTNLNCEMFILHTM